jgi:hypothetical protein
MDFLLDGHCAARVKWLGRSNKAKIIIPGFMLIRQ